MMEFVSWDDELPNIWKVIKIHGSKAPTSRGFCSDFHGRFLKNSRYDPMDVGRSLDQQRHAVERRCLAAISEDQRRSATWRCLKHRKSWLSYRDLPYIYRGFTIDLKYFFGDLPYGILGKSATLKALENL